jgi:hypothetical protein
MTSVYWSGENVTGSNHILICSAMLVFAWRDWGQLWCQDNINQDNQYAGWDLILEASKYKAGYHPSTTMFGSKLTWLVTLPHLTLIYNFMLGWLCIIYNYFVSFPTWYTFIFLFTFTIFLLQFCLYMFRTGRSIIRRIKLHVQHLAPFPHSLLSRVWPLVLTEWKKIVNVRRKIKVYQVGKETKYL